MSADGAVRYYDTGTRQALTSADPEARGKD